MFLSISLHNLIYIKNKSPILEYLRKLGSEKIKNFDSNFDALYDLYRKMANEQGYPGKLKFSRERGKVIIFVELPTVEDYSSFDLDS